MHVFLLSVLITVSAQGRASSAPDIATEVLSISTYAATAAGAAADNNGRYARLSSGLHARGISGDDMRTTGYTINYTPPSAPSPPESVVPQQRSGYVATRTLEVTIRHLNSVGPVIDAAVAAGVTDVGGVTFGISDNRGQYANALRGAVGNARRQAEAMASAAGLHIVRVKTMQEGFAQEPVPRMMAAQVAPGPPTTIQPSSIDTTATVSVTYEAQ